MESRHSVQSTSVIYGGIGEIQKDVPNSRIAGIMLIAVAIFMAWGTFGTVSKTGFDISSLKTTNDWENPFLG